jgi:hypothetical protein
MTAVIVFNQKVRDAEPGARGKLAGVLKSSVLVEVGGKFVTVSDRLLDRLTVCQMRKLSIVDGDRLQLKANRKLTSGERVTNGEVSRHRRENQAGRWPGAGCRLGESESWVRRRMGSIPGVIREGRKHIRIHPRTYLEKRLKIGPNPSSRHSW